MFRRWFITATIILRAAAGARTTTRRRLEDDMSWMKGYTVRYENCFHTDHVATFRLCPAGGSNRCQSGCYGGGDYILDLNFFVDAYTEAQMGAREYRCEMARENCDYDDDAVCYQDAGLSYCDDKNEDENGFDLQEWLECSELDDGYYVGPYCGEDNFNIYLGVFSDEDCTVQVESDIFMDVMGYELPYTSTGIISDECANCKEHALEEDQNGGDDADDDDDVIEQCEELYNEATKCETSLEKSYADTSGCDYIGQLQAEEAVTVGSPTIEKAGMVKKLSGLLIAALILGCCMVGWCTFCRRRKTADGSIAESASAKENLL